MATVELFDLPQRETALIVHIRYYNKDVGFYGVVGKRVKRIPTEEDERTIPARLVNVRKHLRSMLNGSKQYPFLPLRRLLFGWNVWGKQSII